LLCVGPFPRPFPLAPPWRTDWLSGEIRSAPLAVFCGPACGLKLQLERGFRPSHLGRDLGVHAPLSFGFPIARPYSFSIFPFGGPNIFPLSWAYMSSGRPGLFLGPPGFVPRGRPCRAPLPGMKFLLTLAKNRFRLD